MNMHTIAVNRYKEDYDVDVGRASCWGNPFSHDKKSKAKYFVDTRQESIDLYSHWILAQTDLLARLGELKNKRLGCYCLPKSCHAEILAELANNFDETKEFNDYSAFW